MRDPKQVKKVLNHLKKYRFITKKQGRESYAIENLGNVIFLLREGKLDGKEYNIQTDMISGLNRFKEPCTHARYSLEKNYYEDNNPMFYELD